SSRCPGARRQPGLQATPPAPEGPNFAHPIPKDPTMSGTHVRRTRTPDFSLSAPRWCRPLLVGAALGLAFASVGCRITEEDVHRWGSRSQGPRKLVAVLTHAKYPTPLRVEAAMTLVRMKPRGGRPVGLQG